MQDPRILPSSKGGGGMRVQRQETREKVLLERENFCSRGKKEGEIESGRANLFLLPQPKLAGEEFKKEMKDKVFRQKSQTLYRVTIMDGKKQVLSPGILWAVTVATYCPGKQMHVNRGFLSPCIIKLGSRKPNLELFRQLETFS